MPIFHPFGIPSTSSFAVSSSVSEILKVNPATPGVPYALSAQSGPQGVVGTPSVTCPSGYFDASVYSVVGGITFAPVPTKSRDYRLCYQIPTPTPTPTSTTSVTPSVSITVTVTQTVTPTVTPTITSTVTPSVTATRTTTPTVTPSITQTVTPSITVTRTITPTNTPSITTTNTPTVTPSITRTQSITPTNTPSSTIPPTPSATPSVTKTPGASVTPTPSITPTNTITPTQTVTPTVSVTPTRSIQPTPSVTTSAQFLHYCACFATGYDCQLYNKIGGCDAVATDIYAAPGTCHPCTLNVPSPTVTPTRTMTVTPSQAAPAKFIITGTSTQTAGGSQTITITAVNASGATVGFYSGTKTLTFSGAAAAPDGTTPKVDDVAFGTGTSITFTNGIATATLKLYKTEAATIAVTGDGLSATGTDRLIVTVSDAGGNNFVFSGTSTQTAGTSQNITITTRDVYNNTATSYTGTKSLTFSGPSNSGAGNVPTFAGTNRGTATSITFSSGVASSVAMILYAVETATISATATGVTTATSLSVTVSAASATNFVFSGAGSITAGNTLGISITARDAYYNTATSYDGVKSLTFSGANASPSGNTPKVNSVNFGTATSITFSSGVASSLNLQLFKVETATVSATASGVTTATSLSVTVAHAATHNFVLSGGSSSQVAGATRTTTITARDAYFNTATSYTGTKTLTFSGASSAPNGTAPTAEGTAFGTGTSVTFTNGLASDVDIILYKVETAIIQVADGAISSTLGTAITITVSNSTATNFVITGTSTQIAGASQNITISARDAYYNSATSYTGAQSLTFSGPSNAPSGTVPTFNGTNRGSTTSVTFTTGVATVAMILYAAEAATVSATASGITTATSLSVTVTSAVVNYITLAYSSGGTSSGNMKAGGAQYAGESDYFVTLTAKDQYANTCSSGANNINGYYDVLWTGANVSPGNNAGATASTAKVGADDGSFACTGFGAFCGRTWSNGTVTYKLRLYKVETANLAARLYTNYPTNTNYVDQNATHAVAVALGPIGGGNGAMSAVSVTTQTPTVNTTATAPAVKITDDFGNFATGVSVNFARSAGAGCIAAGGGQTTNTVCINITGATDGGAVATLGSWTMPTAASDNATDYDEQVTVTCGTTPGSIIFYAAPKPAAINSFALSKNVGTATAGGSFIVTVTAKDAYNNTLSWGDNLYSGYKNLYFSGPAASPGGSVPVAYTDAQVGVTFPNATGRTFSNGTVGYSVTLYKAETATLTVSTGYSGGPTGTQGTISITTVAAGVEPYTQSSISLADTTLVEGTTATLTLTVRDAYQNPLSDSLVTFAVNNGSVGTKSNPSSGVYTWTYTAPTVTSADVDSGTSQKTYTNAITAKRASDNVDLVGSGVTVTAYDTYGTSYGTLCSQYVPDGIPGTLYEQFADGAGGFYYNIVAASSPPCCAEISYIECFGTCCSSIQCCYNDTCNC